MRPSPHRVRLTRGTLWFLFCVTLFSHRQIHELTGWSVADIKAALRDWSITRAGFLHPDAWNHEAMLSIWGVSPTRPIFAALCVTPSCPHRIPWKRVETLPYPFIPPRRSPPTTP